MHVSCCIFVSVVVQLPNVCAFGVLMSVCTRFIDAAIARSSRHAPATVIAARLLGKKTVSAMMATTTAAATGTAAIAATVRRTSTTALIATVSTPMRFPTGVAAAAAGVTSILETDFVTMPTIIAPATGTAVTVAWSRC